MFEKAISEKTKKDLAILVESKLLDGFYLFGGTGLSLQLGHRLSFDLDFFSDEEHDYREIEIDLQKLGKFRREKVTKYGLVGEFNNTKLTLMYYQYPLLFKAQKYLGINIADVLDIACSKIDTISSRGSKKDFIDLFFVCHERKSLPELWELFQKKYKGSDYNKVHILKSLIYFADADKDEMPRMFKIVDWEKVKDFFEREVKMIV